MGKLVTRDELWTIFPWRRSCSTMACVVRQASLPREEKCPNVVRRFAIACCGSPTSPCTCIIGHLNGNSCKPLECFLHRESVFQSVVAEDEIEASLVVGVSLHDRVILTNCVLPAMTSNQVMQAQAKLGLSLRWLQTFVLNIECGNARWWWSSRAMFPNTTKNVRDRPYLKLPHAHKSGSNVADNLEPNLLSGVWNLEKAKMVPCLGQAVGVVLSALTLRGRDLIRWWH